MEELDRQIVQLLVKDGRMSYTDLGKATGLSTSAVHQRVRRLEQRGVIRGYAAVVDPEAVGLPMTAFISVKPFDPSAPDDIADILGDVERGLRAYEAGRPAEDARLIELDARVRFPHPLVRSAVYRASDPSDRRDVHGS